MVALSHSLRAQRYVIKSSLGCLLLMIISWLPISSLALGSYFPDIWLCAVYYWAIFNPRFIPFGLLFAVGIIQDIFTFMLPGLSATIWIGLRLLLSLRRRGLMQQSFWLVWGVFAIVVLTTYAVQWLIIGNYYGAYYAISPSVTKVLSTIAIYPLLHKWFSTTHEAYQNTRRDL